MNRAGIGRILIAAGSLPDRQEALRVPALVHMFLFEGDMGHGSVDPLS